MKIKNSILLPILFLMAIILSACSSASQKSILKVAFSNEISSLSPFDINETSLERLGNIYEGLVRFDRNLQPEPALAESWGNPDNNTWEFHIREAYFSDGNRVTVDDVKKSLDEYLRRNSRSQIAENIAKVEIDNTNSTKIIIHTYKPDPTLLRKLTQVFITRKNENDFIGTGPYQIKNWEPQSKLILVENKYWWGSSTDWKKVEFLTVPEKRERAQLIENGEIDILADTPPDIYKDSDTKIEIRTLPKLAVTFMGFNIDPEFDGKENKLADINIRQAIKMAIDRNEMTEKLKITTFAQASSQLVGVNVFGFNPEISIPSPDLNQARELLNNSRFYIDLDFATSMKGLAENIQYQLAQIGIVTRLNPLSEKELLSKLQRGESQAFIVNWLAESGDAGNFFEKMISNNGEMNFFHLSDNDLNREIQRAATLIDSTERLPILQELMSQIVEKYIIAIPLFEEEKVYAIQKGIGFHPRQDEAIWAAGIDND